MQADEVLHEAPGAGGGGGGGGGAEDLDGLIEAVARANDALPLQAPAPRPLPALHSTPCAMHRRHLPDDRRGLRLLYSTCCHGGRVVAGGEGGGLVGEMGTDGRHLGPPALTSRSDLTPRGLPVDRDRDRGRGRGAAREGGRGRGARAPSPRGRHQHQQQLPPRLPPRLPEIVASQEVVRTWLQHGSLLPGHTRFPDVARGRHRHSAPSE